MGTDGVRVRFWYRITGEPHDRQANSQHIAFRGKFTEKERQRGVGLDAWIKDDSAIGGFRARTVHGLCEPVRLCDTKPGETLLFSLIHVDLLTLQVGDVLTGPGAL